VNDEVEIVGLKPREDGVHRGGDVQEASGRGAGGDKRGGALEGTKREEVERGQVLASPAASRRHTHLSCEVYVLAKEEGGRHTPFFKGYRPQFYFRTTDDRQRSSCPRGWNGHARGQHQDDDRA